MAVVVTFIYYYLLVTLMKILQNEIVGVFLLFSLKLCVKHRSGEVMNKSLLKIFFPRI